MTLSGVEWANLYGSVDASAARARDGAQQFMLVEMAKHLRWDHALSRRRVAQRLGVREKWIKEFVDDHVS